MKPKTVIAILLTLTLGLLLGACTNSNTKKKTDLLSEIQERGKLVVALNPEFAPFEFKTLIDGKDTIVGSDIELAKAIAKEPDVELELSPMSFDNVLASLQTGKADLAISGISATAERSNVYDFQIASILLKTSLSYKQISKISI